MNNYLKVIFLGFLIIICLLIYYHSSNNINEYDLKELETLSDKIIWDKNKKLKWTDFKFDPNEKTFIIYADVGLATRYNVFQPILFRSHTTLSPKKSIVADTSNLDDLRIAQAKFDLLETYRRKIEKVFDSIKRLESPNFETSDFDSIVAYYYRDYKNEWESYRPFTIESLYRVEDTIRNRLK